MTEIRHPVSPSQATLVVDVVFVDVVVVVVVVVVDVALTITRQARGGHEAAARDRHEAGTRWAHGTKQAGGKHETLTHAEHRACMTIFSV